MVSPGPPHQEETNVDRRVSVGRAAVVGGLLALGLSGAAHAAPVPGWKASTTQWELTGFGGYYISEDLYSVVSAGGEGSTVGLSNSLTWGGRLAVFPIENCGFEFSYTRAGSDLETKKAEAGFAPQSLGRLDYDSFDLDVVGRQKNLGSPGLTLFGLAGFGWTLTHPDIPLESGSTLSSQALFGVNLGAGAGVNLSPSLALRLEARWRITKTQITIDQSTHCDYWGYCYEYTTNSYDSGELSAGLIYIFGAKDKK
jgi:opacity protein-like surface antigen